MMRSLCAMFVAALIPVLVAGGDSMDKLHGETDFSKLATYSWNMFRYIGDYLHLFSVVVLLGTIAKNQSVAGISRTTQVLYCAVFCCRYLDLFEYKQSSYLVFFKLAYIGSSFGVLFIFHKLSSTYEHRHDTFNMTVAIVPCAVAAILLTNEWAIIEILWTFSEFLEGFAMVPQYIFCYRTVVRDQGQTLYVMMMGSYRVCYALNWIYKKLYMPGYSDIQSWIGGIIEIIFFADYLNYRFTGNSFLRTAVLSVDTKIGEISEKVEKNVLGSTRAERKDEEGVQMRRRNRGDDEASAGV